MGVVGDGIRDAVILEVSLEALNGFQDPDRLIEAALGRPVNHALYRDKPMLQFQAIADAGNGLAATMDGDIIVARQLLSLVMGGEFSREMALLMESL